MKKVLHIGNVFDGDKFLTLDKFMTPIKDANPDMTEGQYGVLSGMFIGMCMAYDQAELSQTVCNKIFAGFEKMQDQAREQLLKFNDGKRCICPKKKPGAWGVCKRCGGE